MDINATKQAKNTFGYLKHNPKLNNPPIPVNPNLLMKRALSVNFTFSILTKIPLFNQKYQNLHIPNLEILLIILRRGREKRDNITPSQHDPSNRKLFAKQHLKVTKFNTSKIQVGT